MQSSKLWKILQHRTVEELRRFSEEIGSEEFNRYLHHKHKQSGDSVLHIIARHNQLDMFAWAHQAFEDQQRCLECVNLDGKTPLHEAASSCNADIVVYILSFDKCNVDPLKRAGWTPLMMAAAKPGALKTIKVLVEAGANMNLVNKDGWNVFHIACRTGDLAMLNYLVAKSPDVLNATSTNGRRPIHTAAIHGLTEVVKFLFDSGYARMDEVDGCGSTPIMEAFRSGNRDTVDYTLEVAPASLHITDKLGRNCLHIAAQVGHSALIEVAVNNGIDVNSTVQMDKSLCEGQTALHFAYKHDDNDAIACLIALGASEDIVDVKSRTPKSLRKISYGCQYRALY